MVRCSVLDCKSDGEQKIPGLSFHCFPYYKNLREIWISATGRNGWEPKKTSRMCSKHFEPALLIKKITKTYLDNNAVPTKEIPVQQQADVENDTENLHQPNIETVHTSEASFDTNRIEPYYAYSNRNAERNKIKTNYSSDTNSDHEDAHEWLSQPEVCRCCIASIGNIDLTSVNVSPDGKQEVLLTMLEECFGIILSNISEWGPSRLICKRCAAYLRRAHTFKRQVLKAESRFSKYITRKDSSVDETKVKTEDESETLQPGAEYTHDENAPLENPFEIKVEEDDENIDIEENFNAEELLVEKEYYIPECIDAKAKRPKKTVNEPQPKKRLVKKRKQNEPKEDKQKRSSKTENKPIEKKPCRRRKVMMEMLEFSSETESETETERIAFNEPQFSDEIIQQVTAKAHLNVTCETVLRNTTACPYRPFKSAFYNFKCFYCLKLFKGMNMLRKHTVTHSPGEISKLKRFEILQIDIADFKCRICGETLINIEYMIQHMDQMHGKFAYNECIEVYKEDKQLESKNAENEVEENSESSAPDTTPKVSGRKRLRQTCDIVLDNTNACPFRHHKSWFQCFYCREDFMEMNLLRQHMTEHPIDELMKMKRYPRTLQIEISGLICKICSRPLEDITELVEHFFQSHNIIIYKECIAGYKVNKSPYTCHICNAEFHVFRMLTRHFNEHYSNIICDECGKPFINMKRLQVHKRTHELGDFPCPRCDKVLDSKAAKINHMQTHLKRIIRCHICYQTMKHYNDRVKHMSEEHNVTTKFYCTKCPKEFRVKHYLATHMRQTHGSKNKKCKECCMAFKTNHGLKKHMLKHRGIKFQCSLCSKSYVRKYTLREHIMRAHDGG